MTEVAAVTLEDQHFPLAHLRELISDVDAEAHIKARRYDLSLKCLLAADREELAARLDQHVVRIGGCRELALGDEGVRVIGEALDVLAEELKAEGNL